MPGGRHDFPGGPKTHDRPRQPCQRGTLCREIEGLAGRRQSLLYSRSSGEMDEWFKSHAWKACIG